MKAIKTANLNRFATESPSSGRFACGEWLAGLNNVYLNASVKRDRRVACMVVVSNARSDPLTFFQQHVLPLHTQRNGLYGLLINSKTDKWDHLTEHSNKKFFEITNCHFSI